MSGEVGQRAEGLVVALAGVMPPELTGQLSMLSRQGLAVAVVCPADGATVGGTAVGLEAVPVLPSVEIATEALAAAGVLPGDVAIADTVNGWDELRDLLADQVRRRELRELPVADIDPLWCVELNGLDPELEPAREAIVALGNGTVGVSGAPLAALPGARRWVVANGLYEGDGPDSRLLPGPVGLHLPYRVHEAAALRRVLDLRGGLLYEDAMTDAGSVRAVRFSSIARPGITAMRAACPDDRVGPMLLPALDREPTDEGSDDDVRWMTAGNATHGGMAAAAAETSVDNEGRTIRDRFIAYDIGTDHLPAPHAAVGEVRRAAGTGFDRLLAEHRQRWSERWREADITVDGDERLQLAIRFALFHLIGSVTDEGEAAVGARGLSGEGYRGHVFWDADTFTLPFLAATHPTAARAMLEYRLRRLPAALEIARVRGRSGARWPWESARSGADVTPPFARDRTGRVVPIRTGLLQEHVVAEIPWAAACYVDWTGDEEFAHGPGLRLLVESARYWRSRIRREANGTGHIYGVIGPDEYHEPVDDNAFTNVMARWNLRRAADAVEAAPSRVSDVDTDEVTAWRDAAESLVDGYQADTGVYEQFAGFDRLEPLIIEEVAPHRPIAADLLLGAERVHRAQVLKQADVLMLHHLLPDEVVPGSLEPNLRFYEPLTAHGSSLSPAIHAALFARTRDYRRALDSLSIAARIDLDDLTRTTSGGLHIATMGGLWQAMVFGFAGLRPRAGRLEIDPHLPPSWGGMEVRVRFQGSPVHVAVDRSGVTVRANPPAPVTVGGTGYTAGPGGLRLTRLGATWAATP